MRFNCPSVCGVFTMPGWASRITRYWFVSVKMVDTIRCPKALYSASSTELAVIDSRDAVSRFTFTYAASPCAPASLLTLRTLSDSCSFATSFCIHSVTSALFTPSSDTRYSVGPVSASMVRSCVGCRYSVRPATCRTRSRRRSITSCWLSWLRVRLMSMLPVCSIVLLAASTPTKELRFSTSWSSRMARAACCCSCAMRSKDTSCAACTRACSWPVSCVGNRPLGIVRYSSTVSTSVSSATSSVSGWCAITQCSERS
ncbi:hypothetical protein FQZ97_646780 [compost metagenome]